MKRARVLHDGRVIEVVWKGPGVLEDARGRAYREAAVTFLPPVQPTKVIAVAVNYSGRAAAPFDVVRALRERTAGIAPQYHDRPW